MIKNGRNGLHSIMTGTSSLDPKEAEKYLKKHYKMLLILLKALKGQSLVLLWHTLRNIFPSGILKK